MAKKKNELTAKKILLCYKYAREHCNDWIEESKKDYKYAVGDQWNQDDKLALENVGVLAITLNQITPLLNMVSGTERQNRQDFAAYPIGGEDEITSAIVSRLIKNVVDKSDCQYKMSEMFDDGIICGKGYIDGGIDYTKDLINGELKLSKDSPFEVFPDPNGKEYDMSDCEYVDKLTTDLIKEMMYQLFPKKKKEIDKINNSQIDNLDFVFKIRETHNYKPDGSPKDGSETYQVQMYDLIEHYYKKYVSKIYIVDKKLGKVTQVESEEIANEYIEQLKELERNKMLEEAMSGQMLQAKEMGVEMDEMMLSEQADMFRQQIVNDTQTMDIGVEVVEKIEPEIWCASVCGDTILEDVISPTYPNWKGYPIFRALAHYTTIPLENKAFMYKGIVRDIISPQMEVNKRVTQELRHLNSSANSGWIEEEDSWANEEEVKQLGSVPGVHLKYKKGLQNPPQQIKPQVLSTGHEIMVKDRQQDIKVISGINADLLAMEDKTVSGRAISLRQKQGLVMLQKIFDNYQRTRRIIGRFILSQLGELYTVETATETVGIQFITENFSEPVTQQVPDMMNPGQMITKPVEDPQTGGVMMKVNDQLVAETFNNILTRDLTKFDISLGEGIYTETIKEANFIAMKDLAQSGVPIPPEVLVEDSLLDISSKNKIKKITERAANMLAAQQVQMELGKSSQKSSENGIKPI